MRWGFYYGAFENGGGLRNVTVANNTFYDTTEATVMIENDTHSGSVVKNNIFSENGSGNCVYFTGGGGCSTRRRFGGRRDLPRPCTGP